MKRMSEEALQVNACKRLQGGRDFPWKQEASTMSKKSVVYVRVDSDLKEKAEGILKQLGISPSSAITMFYSQVARSNGLPLDLHLPPAEDDLTPEELDEELEKGVRSIERGDCYTQEEMREIMEKEFKTS